MLPELRVLSEPCDACPFKGRLSLHGGRLRDIIDQCARGDTHFHCHQTLTGPNGEYPHYDLARNAVCAGWLEAVGGLQHAPGQLIRIAQRLGAIRLVDPIDSNDPIRMVNEC